MKLYNRSVLATVLGAFLAACSTAPEPAELAVQATLPGAAAVCFYDDSDYQGRAFCSSGSDAWVGSERNDLVSSVRVADGFRAELFQHKDFGGEVLELTGDTPILAEGFDNSVSSFKVSAADPGDEDRDRALNAKCTPKIELDIEDRSSEAAFDLFDIYPDALVQLLAPEVCRTLYTDAAEVQAPQTVILHLVDRPGEEATWSQPGLPVAEYYVNLDHTRNYSGQALVDEFNSITAHELTHIYQYRGGSAGLTEGVADYVRFQLGLIPEGAEPDKSGNWDDGGYATAFFLVWLEENTPGFVRKLNLAMAAADFSAEAVFRELTGSSPDQLWDDYRNDDS